ncbi:MAG TPA: RES domain-containing protein [Steroidobacteraceae bacterium]
MVRRPKVPRSPQRPLTFHPDDFAACPPGGLWRIARTGGRYTASWNHLREFGPVATMRWDPHEPPAHTQPARAVLYAATSLTTAAAEVWQATRRIDPYTGSPVVARFTPTRPLRLLDLTARGTWAIRNGAGAALSAAPRDVCRSWAREALSALPGLDGLLVPSTLSGMNVVLFAAAKAAMPSRADLLASASDPAMLSIFEAIADAIDYDIDPGPIR